MIPASSTDVDIRGATPADLDLITANEERIFPRPWSRETFDELLGREGARILVASRPVTRVVGHLVYWVVAGEAEVGNVAVLPGDRGRGIATRLLDQALEELTDRGVTRVFLEVRESNEPALRLYRSRAFGQVGRRPDYYEKPKEDALIMARRMDR
jgi:ribosomal-protein-alanine N-acetyltransferase